MTTETRIAEGDATFRFFVLVCGIVALVCGVLICVSEMKQAAGWSGLGDVYRENRVLATTTTSWPSAGREESTSTMLYPGQDVDAWADMHETLTRAGVERRPMDEHR